ncbi:WPP domain-interacting tail-anchored protein 1-like isoform X1 [Chenopodium quinoa]|uniref:WIT1/2 N-terminal helical bundle domain-containing protein n=2 Tax=Chenopodium quinoa TaxID=63459 RepID=A0A803LC63_CHEQI|nr:WPP domain-interacting tail-anchored protein 1-like isoform X1 [Chenopodium quinoa]
MDTNSVHDTTDSVAENDLGGSIEAVSIAQEKSEDASSIKEVKREVGSSIIRIELDIACCSEKLVNLNQLMMHVSARENDFEDFASAKDEDTLVNSDGRALEFDILSGIFDSEVREMAIFIGKIKSEINNTCEVISSYKHLGEGFLALGEKLRDVEESIKQLQEQVSELMAQSSSFQKILSGVNQEEMSDEDKEDSGDSDFLNTMEKLKIQTSQTHTLRMLEKSLARELELENELKECMQARDEMKLKIRFSQQKFLSVEEETTAIYARFLEADSASAVLMGISKELIGKLQSSQLHINCALRRENEMNIKFQECTKTVQNLEKKEAAMQELAEKNRLEALSLKEKVNFLEEKLKASESALVNGNVSLDGKSDQIKDLEKKLSIAESRVLKVEAESNLLEEANKELNEKLDFLKSSGVSVEKVNSLEKQLKETDIQLQEAMASVEASQEKETMLYTSINDMEILIDKLKSKVLEADARADSAEDKCIILSESHAEQNEELVFLRGKLECLEASLQQAEESKRAIAKDISTRSKVITDMVMQLAVERERLHKQLSRIMMENRALVDKLHVANKVSSNSMNHEVGETEEEVLSSAHRVYSTDNGKENKEESDAEEAQKSPEDVLDSEFKSEPQNLDFKLETVRSIDAGRLNVKYVISASLVVLVAILAVCFLKAENCPF